MGCIRAVDFANDVEPILSKFGCNSGGCHGKASGQNGFKLSLMGVDTALDYDALVKQGHGRRVFPAAPDRSLLLTKPTGQCAHGGGKRFEVDSAAYRLLRRWVEQGMPLGKPDSPTVVRIEAVPAERIMHRVSDQQLRVVATLSDGTTKDVTAEAEYRSQQPDLVTVDTDGRATTQDTVGEGTVMVRYRGMVEIARLTVPFGGKCRPTLTPTFNPRTMSTIWSWPSGKNWESRRANVRPMPSFCDGRIWISIGTLPTPARSRVLSGGPRPRSARPSGRSVARPKRVCQFLGRQMGRLAAK